MSTGIGERHTASPSMRICRSSNGPLLPTLTLVLSLWHDWCGTAVNHPPSYGWIFCRITNWIYPDPDPVVMTNVAGCRIRREYEGITNRINIQIFSDSMMPVRITNKRNIQFWVGGNTQLLKGRGSRPPADLLTPLPIKGLCVFRYLELDSSFVCDPHRHHRIRKYPVYPDISDHMSHGP